MNREEYKRAKLTKKFLLGLTTGVGLVSNTARPDGTPIYVAEVVASEEREAQWRTVSECGGAGRLCWIFDTPADYMRWWGKTIPCLPKDAAQPIVLAAGQRVNRGRWGRSS